MAKRSTTRPAQPPIGGKRERTRALLLEAASALLADTGYEGLSMDRVAARAGMTKGAIYGNFANKEELIMAVFLAGAKRAPPPMKAGGALHVQMDALADALIARGPDARQAATRLVAFQLYALTHEDMRRRVALENAAIYRRMEAWVRQVFPVQELPMPPGDFVRVLHALSDGLLVTRALAPELVTSDTVRAVFKALAAKAPTYQRSKKRGQLKPSRGVGAATRRPRASGNE